MEATGQLSLDSPPELVSQGDSAAPSTPSSIYHLKRNFQFNAIVTSIILQSKNGPCPLLALANTLLLRGALEPPSNQASMSGSALIELVAGCMLEQTSQRRTEKVTAEAALEEAIKVLPTLERGLDVNVGFEACDKFEFTAALSVFDVLGIRLYHAWVVHESDPRASVLRRTTYNQLVDLIVAAETSPEKLVHAEIARSFLDESSSQITYTGLTQLHEVVSPGELCVLYRNDHFSVMYKRPEDGALYLLATDAGFGGSSTVGWEKFEDLNGDTTMVSTSFEQPSVYDGLVAPPSTGSFSNAENLVADETADALLAMQLQAEERAGQQLPPAPVASKPARWSPQAPEGSASSSSSGCCVS